jgi:tetratricopeptide (TPR) repeat protein
LNELLKIDNNSLIYYYLSLTYYEINDYNNAINHSKKSLEINPFDPEALSLNVQILYKQFQEYKKIYTKEFKKAQENDSNKLREEELKKMQETLKQMAISVYDAYDIARKNTHG